MIQQPYFWAYIWRKLLIQKHTHTLIVIATLLTIAMIRKIPECPSPDEWV